MLSEKGMRFARQVAANLESKGLEVVTSQGTQYFFEINTEELFKRLDEVEIAKEVGPYFDDWGLRLTSKSFVIVLF